MRTVVDKRELAHLWANQAQEHARTQTGNFYFEGPSIYSYGSHFEIARIVEYRGKKAVLYSPRTYSVTTSSHQSMVRQACRHMTVFTADPGNGRHENFKRYKERYLRTLQEAAASRKGSMKRADLFSHAYAIATQGNEFAKFFGLKGRIKLLKEDEAREAYEKAKESEKLRQKRAEDKAKREFAEKLPKWLANDPEVSWLPEHKNTYFRFTADGTEIQTSHGARFHTQHGQRAYLLLSKLRKAGKTFKANGDQILCGQWHVDEMDENGTVKAGCHTIEWSVIEEFAQKAGW
jgi:hypothetical protein